jgi:hypothetical protein
MRFLLLSFLIIADVFRTTIDLMCIREVICAIVVCQILPPVLIEWDNITPRNNAMDQTNKVIMNRSNEKENHGMIAISTVNLAGFPRCGFFLGMYLRLPLTTSKKHPKDCFPLVC